MTGHERNAPAGWYPVDGGVQRYWDGMQWTDHVIAPNAQQGQAPQPGPMPQPGQTPQPGHGYAPGQGQAPGQGLAGPGSGQAPFVQPQPGWTGGGWQDPSAAPYGQVPQPLVDSPYPTYPMHVSASDRSSATVVHLLGLVFGFLGPLIMYLAKKDESPYVAEQSKEALNFQLSLFIYWVGSLFALIVLIGFLLIPILIVLQFVLPIVAAVATNKGERFRYPLTLRMIS